ncbi:MAG TPA: hypothetical protein VFJ98_09210 [Mycobacteriales bacterium]|nr:hypothetical protein [Mycobacteriales bacterium]
MRTTRLARLAVLLALPLSLVAAAPAQAATVTVSHAGIPNPLYADPFDNCSSGGNDGTTAHVVGPGTPPRGVGSLRLSVPADQYIEFGRVWNGAGPDEATHAAMSIFVPSTAGSHAIFGAWALQGTTAHEMYISLAHNGAWTSYNLMDGNQHTTHDLDISSGNAASNESAMTWTQWVGLYAATADTTYLFIAVDTCGRTNGASVYTDSVRLGRTGDSTDTIFDMEPSLTATVSRSKIVAGDAVTLRATLYGPSGPRPSQLVALWARRAGADSFSRLTEVLTNDNGVASFTHHPSVNTTYEWRFAGDGTTPATASQRRAVKVARKLTLKVADTSLGVDQKLKARGATTPVGKGLTVKLWKKRSGADLLIAKTTTASDGTWHVSKDLAKGRYDLYATVAATTRNLAGKSRVVTVTAA